MAGFSDGSPAQSVSKSGLLDELRQRFPRVAVVHDWLTIPGGSENVVLELLEMFPQAELFTSIYDPRPWPEQITDRPVHASFLSRIPNAATHYKRLLPLMNRAYRSFDLSRFDLVLSSSHASAKNIRTPARTLHICYCHTPMRYAWDERFLQEEEVGSLVRLGLPALMWHMRRQDLKGASAPDVFVANSAHVAARIQRHYGRSAEVVHPPVAESGAPATGLLPGLWPGRPLQAGGYRHRSMRTPRMQTEDRGRRPCA